MLYSVEPSPNVIWPKKKKINLKPGQLDLRPVAVCRVAATQGVGLKTLTDVLQHLVMTVTKRRRVQLLVPTSGSHLDWLRANCCVEDLVGHGDFQFLIRAIVTEAELNTFLSRFDDAEVLKHSEETAHS